MPEEPLPFITPREKGRLLACEGILRSHFGVRMSGAAARAVQQLREEADADGSNEKLGRQIEIFDRPGLRTKTLTWVSFRRWLPVLAAAACVAIGLGLVYLWWLPETAGPVVRLFEGRGVVLKRMEQSRAARNQEVLLPGDSLMTGTGSHLALVFAAESTVIKLDENSQLQWLGANRGKRLFLALGKCEARVAHQRWFHPLEMLTPQAKVRVLGTEFTLMTTGRVTQLTVAKGKVKMTQAADGRTVIVAAGHYSRVPATKVLAALPITGGILREYWTNTVGVSDLHLEPTYPNRPAGRDILPHFEDPSHAVDNYGARYRGFLQPPTTGQYIFWIAADEHAELYLSRDDHPDHKQQIAYAKGTGAREWGHHRGQQSAPLTLEAGRRYYIEALHHHSTGEDHLAVAWKEPGQEREIISGEFIEPFKPSSQGGTQ